MIENSRKVLISTAIAALILGGGGVYFYVQKKSAAPQPVQPAQTAQTTTTQAATSSPYYVNNKLGFQFTLGTLRVQKEATTTISFVDSKTCSGELPKCYQSSVSVSNLNVYYPTLAKLKKSQNLVTWGPDITIAGQPAIKGVSTGALGTTIAVVIYKNKVYTLTRDIVTNADILSSFKFTN